MATALVTGASSDLGYAIVRRLLADGHAVIATARSVDRLRALEAEGATPHAADLTQPADLDALGATGATILVHAAGHRFAYQRFHAADPAEMQRVWQVDHRAFACLSASLLPAMMAARWGRVVAVTSVAARIGADGAAAYASAKAASEALIRNLALEYGRFGITCNAVAPGPIDTARLRERTEDPAALARATCLRRLADPDDIAGPIAFLCGAGASYITGATLPVDGGLGLAARWT